MTTPHSYPKARIEAISDGILAIIMTILVLSIPLPQNFNYDTILLFLYQVGVFLASFIVMSIYWKRHFYLFRMVEDVSKKVISWNFIFLMWLSLIPILLKWVLENPFETVPAVAYAIAFVGSMLVLNHLARLVMASSPLPQVQNFNRRLNKLRSRESQKEKLRFWLFMLGSTSGIAVPIVISFFAPFIANMLLVGVPLLLSLVDAQDDRWSKLLE